MLFQLDNRSGYWHDHKMRSLSLRPEWRSLCGGMRPVCFLFLAAATASLANAQTGAPGTPQSAPRRTVWDGAYTEAQATRGVGSFSLSCAGCHALTPGGKAPLVGDAFWKSFAQKNVGEMLEFISKYMPNGNPGSLGESVNEDIAAYILKSNGFPAGTTELAPKTSANVQIIQRDGSTALPANALVRFVGCLTRKDSDWVVTRATTPERAENAVGEDATRPLGSRTMALKFVISHLEGLVGSRVVVTGLLIGTDGVNGINVTTVNRVAPKCP